MKLIDYHMHSHWSPDGRDTIKKMAEYAILSGVSEIAITDHYDGCGWGIGVYQQMDFFAEIAEVQNLYKDQITIISGLEVGDPYLQPVACNSLLAAPYDFVLGSVHDIDGADLNKIDWSKNTKQIVNRYYELVNKVIDFGNFDCLAHLDLPKRYAFIYNNIIIEPSDYIDQIAGIFNRIIPMGKGIEVNISGLRTEMQMAMPSKEVLQLYKSMGGEIVTIGTDSHTAEHIGSFVEETASMLDEIGLTPAVYRQREIIE